MCVYGEAIRVSSYRPAPSCNRAARGCALIRFVELPRDPGPMEPAGRDHWFDIQLAITFREAGDLKQSCQVQ